MSYDENRISDLIDGGIKKENELFKGTKGEWIMTTSKKGNHFMNVSGNYEFIKVYSGNKSGNVIRQKANALLISKAPDMLEMLQKVLKINKHHNFNGHLINQQIEQLIKQATEL